MSMLPPFVSPEFTRKDVERPIPPTEYGLLVGGIRCTRATASASEDGGGSDDAERVDVPPADECSQIISLESVQPDIGCVNRQLIAERTRSAMPPLKQLKLPSIAAAGTSAAIAAAASAATTEEKLAAIDALWKGDGATRFLWLRYLGKEDSMLAKSVRPVV